MKLSLLFALFLSLISCGHREATAEPSAPAKVKAAIQTVTPVPWAESYRTTGTVEATTRTVLSSQITGTIRQITVETGDRVAAGQTLVVLNANELSSAQAQAEASQREAIDGLPELESAIEASQAQLKLAEITQQRLAGLLAKRSVTQQEMDEADTRLRQARATLAAAQARRRQADARVSQSQQAVKSAQTLSGYTTIRAPFAGVITEKQAQLGMLASPGAPLLTVENTGAYRIQAAVEESRAGQLRLGQPIRVIFEDGASAIETRISEIAPAMDAATRTVTIKAALPPSPNQRSGRFAKVEWPLASQSTLTVPVDAVRTQGQLQMVLVVENTFARTRMVTLGEIQDGRYRVLSGLNAGETIVSKLTEAIVDGVPIEVSK